MGRYTTHIDEYFYHRVKQCVKKDGTISYENSLYEVAFDLVGKLIYLEIGRAHV